MVNTFYPYIIYLKQQVNLHKRSKYRVQYSLREKQNMSKMEWSFLENQEHCIQR